MANDVNWTMTLDDDIGQYSCVASPCSPGGRRAAGGAPVPAHGRGERLDRGG